MVDYLALIAYRVFCWFKDFREDPYTYETRTMKYYDWDAGETVLIEYDYVHDNTEGN